MGHIDGTYVVEFRTAEGEALAISIPRSETAVTPALPRAPELTVTRPLSPTANRPPHGRWAAKCHNPTLGPPAQSKHRREAGVQLKWVCRTVKWPCRDRLFPYAV